MNEYMTLKLRLSGSTIPSSWAEAAGRGHVSTDTHRDARRHWHECPTAHARQRYHKTHPRGCSHHRRGLVIEVVAEPKKKIHQVQKNHARKKKIKKKITSHMTLLTAAQLRSCPRCLYAPRPSYCSFRDLLSPYLDSIWIRLVRPITPPLQFVAAALHRA